MRKFVVGLMAVALLAGVASAAPIHFYFSHQSSTASVPPEWTTQTNLVSTAGTPVYLWARLTLGERWVGIGMVYDQDITAGMMENPSWGFGGATKRWETGSDFDPVGPAFVFPSGPPNNHIVLVAVAMPGLGGDANDPGYVVEGGTHLHYRVGWLTPAALPMRMGIGLAGIARSGGTAGGDLVFFGFGDAGLPNNTFHGFSALPDIVPEPASLMLLGLAALALRRR